MIEGMRRTLLFVFWLLPIWAQTNQLTPQERAEGWKLLFDGKSLSEFHDPRTMVPPGDSWVVEDECIKAARRPRIREDLVTRTSFANFEFAWEWKISTRGNSGVKYRIQDFILLVDRYRPMDARFEVQVNEAAKRRMKREDLGPTDRSEDYVVGFEYQMIDDAGHPDARNGDTHTSGALYDMLAPKRLAAKPAGEWNQSRLVVVGDRIEHWLNGEKVVEGTLNDAPVTERIQRRWAVAPGVQKSLLSRPAARTPISLQNHNDEAWFRNLKVRELP
jgi:hypothetical protein